MAKFHITVNLDWLDEYGNIDDKLKGEIVKKIVDAAYDKAFKSVEAEALEKLNGVMKGIDATISDRLNKIVEEFFTTPKNVTDKWGDVVETGVTVVDKLKKSCEDFLNDPVDSEGRRESGYNPKYRNRMEYITEKLIKGKMEVEIKGAVETAVKKVKDSLQSQVNTQLGEKLGALVGIGDLFK